MRRMMLLWWVPVGPSIAHVIDAHADGSTGWYGLAAAKSYLEMHPTENMAVFESADSCGGTWAKTRLYPGLKSNNMVGTYEYPDFPMAEAYNIAPNTHIPAATLHRYLTDFAKKFGVFDRVQFHTTVKVVQPNSNGGWKLDVASPTGERTVETAKLILATGLTSTPNMPQYASADSFGAPLFHAKDFCKQAPYLDDVKNAVVVGGAKSALDVAYAMVEDGATVDLIIRSNGHGPVWIPPMLVTPFKQRIDKLIHMRFLTWMSPCPWGWEDGFPRVHRFLHGTSVGRFIVDSFWKILGSDALALNGYDSHDELKKLKPWHSAFWIGSGLSILNYDKPIFDMVKQGKIRVHIDNIDHLEHRKVVLATGTTLDADVLINATGWNKETSFAFDGLDEYKLGLKYDAEEKRKLNKEADAKVLEMFPRLKNQPDLGIEKKEGDPLRLYRFIVPPTMIEKRNIAFAGMVSSVSTSITASIQGLWISTFLDGKLDRMAQNEKEITDEIMLHTQWGKWRYPCGYGAALPDFAFEALTYVDLLLNDLHINNHRKPSLFKELTAPYTPGDFANLAEEWRDNHGGERKKDI